MTIQSEPIRPTDAKIARKPYHKPELMVYGDIRELTQTVGNMGAKDGGSGNTSRSQP